jgi:spore maturation protein CgeB
MARSKIIVTACPEGWEGDYRLMEAMSSGALVIHNEMLRPPNGLMNKEHWVTYRDIPEMLERVYYYMKFPEEARAIGEAGKHYVLNNHRPHHRLEQWLRTVSII